MRTEQEKISIQKITDFADKTLLIVDDDNPLRDRLARAMEKKGFQVDEADSVKQGISKAKNAPPAFAVIDLRLGDGNGLEVIKEIRRLKKNSRVVMLTGYGNIPTAVAAVKAGVKNNNNKILNNSANKNGSAPNLNIGLSHPIKVPNQIKPKI